MGPLLLLSKAPALSAPRRGHCMSDNQAAGPAGGTKATEPSIGAAGNWIDSTPATWEMPADFQPNPTLNRNVRMGQATEDEALLESPASQPPARADFTASDPWRV